MAKHKILVIDDDENLTELLKIQLEYYGYQVFCLNSALDAIPKAQEIKPDLIILDIMMPDKDGYDVCYELKNNNDTSSIPVILFTGQDKWKIEMGEISKFVKADEYITKPFEPEVLLEKIKKLLK